MIELHAAYAGAVRRDAPFISDVAHLGGRGALYLLALIRAHKLRQRVAPTQEATAAVLSTLHALGIVRADRHSTPTSQLTAGDRQPWIYTWPQVPFDELEARLVEHLTEAGRDTRYLETWLTMWQDLIPAEVVAYLQYQLRIHQYSDVYLEELNPLLLPDDFRFSLGHWRYACWASVRSMASISLQHPGNEELLRFTLRNELSRRLQVAFGSPGDKLCFSPSYSMPDCALSNTFANVATQLGDNFWKVPPAYNLLQDPLKHHPSPS